MWRSFIAAGVVCMALQACGGEARLHRQARELTGGDPDRGLSAIGRYGCASCHEIPGIGRARVGPPLTGVASRAYLAGRLPNTPATMAQWIQHPQAIEPGNVMPEMGVTDDDARDIVAYLYTLR